MSSTIRNIQKKVPDYSGWVPYDGRRYWYIDSQGRICFVCWRSDREDRFRFLHQNCYKSQKDAEFFLKNINTKYKLKQLALLLNNEKNINWASKRQIKYHINLNSDGSIEQFECKIVAPGQICCLSEDFLEKALDEIGKKDLIEMIVSGV